MLLKCYLSKSAEYSVPNVFKVTKVKVMKQNDTCELDMVDSWKQGKKS